MSEPTALPRTKHAAIAVRKASSCLDSAVSQLEIARAALLHMHAATCTPADDLEREMVPYHHEASTLVFDMLVKLQEIEAASTKLGRVLLPALVRSERRARGLAKEGPARG